MKELLLTSSALILALLLLRKLFQRTISRRVQYALWGLVLLRLLVPVSLPAAGFSVLTISGPVRERVEARMEGPVYLLPVEETNVLPQSFPETDRGHVVGVSPAGYAVLSEDGASLTTYALTTDEALGLAWKVGIGGMACWLLLTNLRFWLLLRKRRTPWPVEGCKRRVFLVEEGLPSPCLFGLFRPAVYLTPAAAAPDTLRYVLAHEETHARHLDHLWALLRGVCLAVYWFNPLVWWAAITSRTDCELACDEGALARLGEDERLAYGRALLSLIPVRRGPANPMLSATTMASGKKQLKERITRIAENRRTVTAALCAAVLLAAGVCAVTFTGGVEKPRDAGWTDPTSSVWKPAGTPELTIPLTAENAASAYEQDAPGLTRLLEEHPGETLYQADYDGDGVDEIFRVAGTEVYYYFQRGGILYQVELCSLLADYWLDRWEASKMRFIGLDLPGDGQPMTIHFRLPVPGSTASPQIYGFDAERQLVFEGDELLVYRSEPETIDHVLAVVEAPAEVIAGAKALGEAASRESWGSILDWRIADLRQIEVSETDGLDAALEVYMAEYEIQGDASAILAMSYDITLKEGGWAGGFSDSIGWLVYQIVDGRRVLLESNWSSRLEWNPEAFRDWYFAAQNANDPAVWLGSEAMQAFGTVLGGGPFTDVLTGEELTLARIGEIITGDEQLWEEARVFRFAVVDLDRDGTPEAVLSIGLGDNEASSEILRYENGAVLGYNLWYRAFYELRADGTFQYSGGASNSGCATLRFTEEDCVTDTFTYVYMDEDFEPGYRVNGVDATEGEFLSALHWQWAKPTPLWFSFTPDNIASVFGS